MVIVVLCSNLIIVCNALPLFWHGKLTGITHEKNHGYFMKDEWITQRLDHFDDSNLVTWQQVSTSGE